MYKVFLNDKGFYFTNNKEFIKSLSNCLVINFFSKSLIDDLYRLLKKDSKIEHILFNVKDTEGAFIAFQHHFKSIKAAGGWVRNIQNKTLFIHRLGKWDLPKGKIEEGEKKEAAAIREVEEECGIKGLKIIKQLLDTFHLYELGEKVILKQTFWYEMITNFDGDLIPQIEENITEAVWFSNNEIHQKALTNTYASIKELITLNVD
ncbi:MAG: NUDIX domain-containing protein [Vicingus serpentipes]|nr:NUDIX domain-containing protein [Vicingus serpentipes]